MKNHIVNLSALSVTLVLAHGANASLEKRIEALESSVSVISTDVLEMQESRDIQSMLDEHVSKTSFGGYGEIHANFTEGGKDKFDIHRLVFYVGYEFAEWIKLTSETEIEHAFVSDGDGEISIEQLYVDFLFTDAFNARAGRVLAPIGIINQHHEPILFFGVERPNADKNIIPSTWSLDGIGIFGFPLGWLSYEAYVVAGLDGSKFRAKDGVRKGRIKERGDLGNPAVTGRLDIHPLVTANQDVRIGISGYHGGTDNADEGGGNGTNNTFSIYSADFEYNVSRVHLRGVVAHGENSDAKNLPAGTGEEIFGWYVEGGVSILPDGCKKGKLAEADIIPFVRYEEYDTQYKVPAGITKAGSNERSEVTIGINMLLTPEFVVKADYQFLDDKGSVDRRNQFNLGMGWVFH